MFERCIYFNLNALTRRINRRWERAFGAVGLSPGHAYTLRAILDSPGLSMKELAEVLQLDASTITRFVDALQHRGLASRGNSETDKRSFGVFPTRTGIQLQDQLEQIGQELYEEMRGYLGDEQFDELVLDLRTAQQRVTDKPAS